MNTETTLYPPLMVECCPDQLIVTKHVSSLIWSVYGWLIGVLWYAGTWEDLTTQCQPRKRAEFSAQSTVSTECTLPSHHGGVEDPLHKTNKEGI